MSPQSERVLVSQTNGKQEQLSIHFGESFMSDHAGRIMSDPRIAIVELVSNAWDAGADTVQITWPDVATALEMPPLVQVAIADNGVGMTKIEFQYRWLHFNYNRVKSQGDEVVFPSDNRKSKRKAFGRNGKGRHSMFCFASTYFVRTWKDGTECTFKVQLSPSLGQSPYIVTLLGEAPREGHGTEISAELVRNALSMADVAQLIGTRFALDPEFEIFINHYRISLRDLKDAVKTEIVSVEGVGTVSVHLIHSPNTGRTSDQHGIIWWVNRKMVGGESSWRDDEAYLLLDGRLSAAKQYSFIVEADVLQPYVESDWEGFKRVGPVFKVRDRVRDYIKQELNTLFADKFRANKQELLVRHIEGLKTLSVGSRKYIGQFVDKIQEDLVSIDNRVVSAALAVITKLEQSRNGYDLLSRLARLSLDDLDGLNEILKTWTVQEARCVLDELGKRLNIIESINKVITDPAADELHDIHPLFENALWIFGPEFEGISFTSNRALTTVVRELFKGKGEGHLTTPKRRPDLIGTVPVNPADLSVYSQNSYSKQTSEIDGIAKVLILELKRGGFPIGRVEQRQGQDYADQLITKGSISNETEILVFVLGSSVEILVSEPMTNGKLTVHCRKYDMVLQQAHSRTFNLMKQLKQLRHDVVDKDVEAVLGNMDYFLFPY